ncbi:MAG: hypothetical protein [Bacteriophage sp.]|uniref:hypothetical protein n=1 Tax=Megamonas sp. TaxID=2049033 RepID=UPI0021FF7065|nr:hypothetical protein [Megamonas sp.]UVX36155.1 MAG: hypothetical protein [Bacteriophage sp.]UWI03253.1 MAG: hypothetical protein [Bacteriophage sp.]
MADETIRVLFNKVDELTVQTTRIETLLVETVIANQKNNAERLDRHSKKIDVAFERIKELENDKKHIISIKNLVIGFIGVVATCTSIVLGLTQLMR